MYASIIRIVCCCRAKLEYYEQTCAVDSVTKKCAGSPTECRAAILGILGTDLRTTCACKGTDMTQLYECLGWQRLLWVNPCVGKSHVHVLSFQFSTPSTHRQSALCSGAGLIGYGRSEVRPCCACWFRKSERIKFESLFYKCKLRI